MPAFDKYKSKIRMVMLTKPGLSNPVWYSILSHDHEPQDKIIRDMMRRFRANPALTAITHKVSFYDNQTNPKQFITSYTE